MTTHVALPVFTGFSGCKEQPRMLIIGEAWGEHEATIKKPFVGASGRELFLMLGEALPTVEPALHAEAVSYFRYGAQAWVRPREAWLRAAGIGMTNVLALRPPDNKIEQLCCAKSELPEKGRNYVLPALSQGRYLRPEYLPEIDRVRAEIDAVRPNLVLALGNTASLVVCGTTGIGAIRGTVSQGVHGLKTLATYHPAGVMRNWAWRPIVVSDLMKAWRESASPVISRPSRQILIDPTEQEIDSWVSHTLTTSPSSLSVDIETKAGFITCIGFATSEARAMVVPFYSSCKTSFGNVWLEAAQEERVWLQVWRLLGSNIPKIFQNGMYDLQYLMRMGLRVRACDEDTMLMHHAIYPEMNKGLGFLGSVYTNESSWKLMRKHKGDEVGVKADE